MKDRGRIIIIVVTTALVLLAVYWIFLRKDKKHFNWYETYRVKSDQPFGTKFIFELLESRFDKVVVSDNRPLRQVITDTTDYNTGNNYVLIGGSMHLSDDDEEALLNFVSRGNNAFISCKDIPDDIMDAINTGECDGSWTGYSSYRREKSKFNFFHDNLEDSAGYPYNISIMDIPQNYNWLCIDGSYFCDSSSSFAEIGYVDSFYTNFASINYGKGKFYLHTSPVVFTNFFMKDKHPGLAYADVVFSHLGKGPIIWDEYSKVVTYRNNDDSGGSLTPLSYILSQKGLRYAWYMLLVGALLYLLFVARRRQRVIDVIEPNTNTSLSYISTISALYFNNTNHIAIAHHKMRYFMAFVRSRYNLSIHVDDKEQVTRLSQKSKIPVHDIYSILTQYDRISKSFEIGETALTDLHNALENFYTNCK